MVMIINIHLGILLAKVCLTVGMRDKEHTQIKSFMKVYRCQTILNLHVSYSQGLLKISQDNLRAVHRTRTNLDYLVVVNWIIYGNLEYLVSWVCSLRQIFLF